MCEPAGNVTHGPHEAGGPTLTPGGASTASGSRSSATSASPGGGEDGDTHTTRSSEPSRTPSSSSADGATVRVSWTSGRSARNAAITAGKCTTAATSIIPTRTRPLRPPRTASDHVTRSPVSASTRRA